MATKRQRKRKRKFIDESNLTPKIREGLTQDVSLAEIEAEDVRRVELNIVREMLKPQTVGRVPLPKFVGQDAESDLVVTFADGRQFRDVNKTFPPETFRALQAGMICLKCLEPQPASFADVHLPGCEGVALAGSQYMKKRQILDLSMEFEGAKHIGPQKPLREYFDELELRAEKRRFEQKVASGASRMKGLLKRA